MTRELRVRKPVLLVFTDWFPPGYRAGGPIRSTANLIAALRDDCDIRVVTSDRDFGCAEPYADLAINTWLPHLHSAQVIYLPPSVWSPAKIGELLQEVSPDCIYLNSMFSLPFTIAPLWQVLRGRVKGRTIIAPRGMLHAGALRFKPIKKHAFLLALRATGLGSRVWFHATDEQEQRDIQSRLGVAENRIHVLPNLPEPPAVRLIPIEKRAGAARMLYLSRITPKKRLLFLLETMARLPDDCHISLTVAGPVEDAAYWAACQRAIAALPPHIAVECLDAVPHAQVRELLESHHFYVLPTLGENFGHGIIEALGAGRPVIISDQTPWRGLEAAGVGWDVAIDQTDHFIRAISSAVRLGQAEYDQMTDRAWSFAKAHVADDAVIAGYRRMFGVP
jgi:glycosyltransferase involved in cell wall biosynthesis